MDLNSVNFSGLSTGIDTESIIQQMLAVDKRPEDLMKNDAARIQQKQQAYATVSAQLLSLQASASVLDNIRAFNLVTASAADDSVATVTAQTGAQTGTHTLTVTNLAKGQRISMVG